MARAQATHVLCFLLLNVWLLPFGFFLSLSINEAVLPDSLAASAGDVYAERGGRSRQKSGIADHPHRSSLTRTERAR